MRVCVCVDGDLICAVFSRLPVDSLATTTHVIKNNRKDTQTGHNQTGTIVEIDLVFRQAARWVRTVHFREGFYASQLRHDEKPSACSLWIDETERTSEIPFDHKNAKQLRDGPNHEEALD